jgi:hypothetical protein
MRGCIQDPRPRPNIYRTSSSQPPARGVGGGASTAQRARGQKFQKPQARSHKPEEARRQRSALTAQSNGQNALLINCGWGMEMRKLPCGPRRVVCGSCGAACALHAACCMAVRGRALGGARGGGGRAPLALQVLGIVTHPRGRGGAAQRSAASPTVRICVRAQIYTLRLRNRCRVHSGGGFWRCCCSLCWWRRAHGMPG